MNNYREVEDRLQKVYDGLAAKTITHRDASEMTNAMGKIVRLRQSQLDYFNLRKERPAVSFWHEPTNKEQL